MSPGLLGRDAQLCRSVKSEATAPRRRPWAPVDGEDLEEEVTQKSRLLEDTREQLSRQGLEGSAVPGGVRMWAGTARAGVRGSEVTGDEGRERLTKKAKESVLDSEDETSPSFK